MERPKFQTLIFAAGIAGLSTVTIIYWFKKKERSNNNFDLSNILVDELTKNYTGNLLLSDDPSSSEFGDAEEELFECDYDCECYFASGEEEEDVDENFQCSDKTFYNSIAFESNFDTQTKFDALNVIPHSKSYKLNWKELKFIDVKIKNMFSYSEHTLHKTILSHTTNSVLNLYPPLFLLIINYLNNKFLGDICSSRIGCSSLFYFKTLLNQMNITIDYSDSSIQHLISFLETLKITKNNSVKNIGLLNQANDRKIQKCNNDPLAAAFSNSNLSLRPCSFAWFFCMKNANFRNNIDMAKNAIKTNDVKILFNKSNLNCQIHESFLTTNKFTSTNASKSQRTKLNSNKILVNYQMDSLFKPCKHNNYKMSLKYIDSQCLVETKSDIKIPQNKRLGSNNEKIVNKDDLIKSVKKFVPENAFHIKESNNFITHKIKIEIEDNDEVETYKRCPCNHTKSFSFCKDKVFPKSNYNQLDTCLNYKMLAYIDDDDDKDDLIKCNDEFHFLNDKMSSSCASNFDHNYIVCHNDSKSLRNLFQYCHVLMRVNKVVKKATKKCAKQIMWCK